MLIDSKFRKKIFIEVTNVQNGIPIVKWRTHYALSIAILSYKDVRLCVDRFLYRTQSYSYKTPTCVMFCPCSCTKEINCWPNIPFPPRLYQIILYQIEHNSVSIRINFYTITYNWHVSSHFSSYFPRGYVKLCLATFGSELDTLVFGLTLLIV